MTAEQRRRAQTVLVLRALGLGDLLTGVPALRAVRRAWPDHALVLAAPADLRPLVDLVGGVDRVHDHAGVAPLDWRSAPPAVAVNLHGRGPQSHQALLATVPRRLVAFHQDGLTPTWAPRWTADEPEPARWCRLLVGHGVAADPTDLLLPAPDPLPGLAGATVLHVGAKDPARRWPPDRFAAVARALAAAGHRVVVTGGSDPAERRAAATVAGPDGHDLAGRTSLAELTALVAHARLVVSGDTGTAHLATAFARPSVVLFGTASVREWGPSRDGHLHRALAAPAPGDDAAQALARLQVGDVLAAVGELERRAAA